MLLWKNGTKLPEDYNPAGAAANVGTATKLAALRACDARRDRDAAGIEMRSNAFYPRPPGQIPDEVAELAAAVVERYAAAESGETIANLLG